MSILRRNWIAFFLVFYGGFVLLPFLAPVLMKWNVPGLGKAIYFAYGFVCHQLPQRSLFFFGRQLMYSVAEIQEIWQITDNPLILRQLIGNPEMGWKVAWSDRMISMYGGIWLAGLLWMRLQRHKWKISVWMFGFLALPMVLDGLTHFVSDFSGLTKGFRYTNQWLAVLTRSSFPQSFYVGDGSGSFNSWARGVTGMLFAFGLVWWAFPHIEESIHGNVAGSGETLMSD